MAELSAQDHIHFLEQIVEQTEERTKNDTLTEQIIGAAIQVHRELGPGLLESAYETCLCHELSLF